jgi:hypothetical protein
MTRAALVLALVTLSLSWVETQPYRNVADWHLSLTDADGAGREFRLYDAPRELRVSLAMSNLSGLDLVIDDARLRERISFAMKGDQEIPIAASWSPDAGSRALRWTLTRKDGQPFTVGRYQLDVVVRRAYEVMRTRDGQPLRGIEHQSASLFVTIQPPANARERSAALRQLGKKTLATDRSEGLRLLVLATEADPTALLDLGLAYVQIGRCQDATSVFERALKLPRTLPSIGFPVSIHLLLAHAYVCAGNEGRATQVLRDAGQTEERIKDTIGRFRQSLAR